MNNSLGIESGHKSDNQPEEQSSKIHFRCPTCSKLYAAKTEHIYSTKPEFTCSSCSTDFWISLDDALSLNEVVGHIIEPSPAELAEGALSEEKNHNEIFDQEIHQKDFVSDSDQVIASAGMIGMMSENTNTQDQEEKFDILNELEGIIDEVEASEIQVVEKAERLPEEKDFWSNVLNDYNDLSLHDEFVEFCREQENIDYALKQYQSMLDVNQHDQIAKTYLNKIKLSSVNELESDLSDLKEEYERTGRLGAWSAGLIGVGLLFVVLGFSFEGLKNLVGLGISLIFFTIALQALFYKPKNRGL